MVRKLISSPSDYPRAYICDECIEVCLSILEDDRPGPSQSHVSPTSGSHPLLDHPLAPSLMHAIENWVQKESSGQNWVPAFGDVRRIAMQMLGK